MKKKLLELIDQHTTPQTASMAPMLKMALLGMSEEDVREMMTWLKSLLAGLEGGDE